MASDVDSQSDDGGNSEEDARLEEEFAKTVTLTKKSVARRSVVCTELYSCEGDVETPVFAKDNKQREVIVMAVIGSFLFGALRPETTNKVVDAFRGPMRVSAGQTIIREGDHVDGSEAGIYVLEKGCLDAFKAELGVAPPGNWLCSYTKQGQIFGDLALLYNCPRAASVVAKEDSVLWTLDRDSFNKCVKGSEIQHREKLDKFLCSVEIFDSLTQEDRNIICDVVRQRDFMPGNRIIRAGEEGTEFYMIMRGSAQARDGDRVVQEYQQGGYFGELALLSNQPRSVDVYAGDSEGCSVAMLDNACFKRLLGPLNELMAERARSYTQLGAEANRAGSNEPGGPQTPAAVQANLAGANEPGGPKTPAAVQATAPMDMPFAWLCCSCGVKSAGKPVML